MHFRRNIGISVLILVIGAGSFTLSRADTTVLDTNYAITAGGGLPINGSSCDTNQSSPTPISFNCQNYTVVATADGSTGPSGGFLSTYVNTSEEYGATAYASMDFDNVTSISLTTSGGNPCVGCFGISTVELTDVTDNLVLFHYSGAVTCVNGPGGLVSCKVDLADSFSSSLNPLTVYSLSVQSILPVPDNTSGRVDYVVGGDPPVPEPSSFALLVTGLPILAIAFRKRPPFVGEQRSS